MKGIILKIIILLAVVAVAALIGGYFALIKGVPQIEEIKGYLPSGATRVYADDDTLLTEFRIEKGVYVPISKIPESVIRAIVAVEDSRFWQHEGVDYIAILRAIFKDILARRIKEGASTITQQLAKVVFLSPEQTIIRKLKEVTLAYRLENNLTKEEIMELYLNKIYFGHGAYGIEMAARSHFGKSVSDISLAEAALLCGLVKAPSKYSPYNNLDKAKERQFIVLKRMVEMNYITRDEAEKTYEEPLYLASARMEKFNPNYFLEYVRKYLEDTYGVDMTYRGGLKVYTTLQKNVQSAAINSLKQGLRDLDKRQGFRGPLEHLDINVSEELQKKETFRKVVMNKGDFLTATALKVSPSEAVLRGRGIMGKLLLEDARWAGRIIDANGKLIKKYPNLSLTNILKPGDVINVRVKSVSGKEPLFELEQEPLVQGALVALEPATGYIRAIVGGYDFDKSEFNRAVSARRQAGSAFKPFIYAAAMNYGYTPASILIDEPLIYESKIYGDWEPENYDIKYHGATRLRDALMHSRNIVTVKLLEELGIGKMIDFATEMGIKGPFPRDLTLALGSLSVSPLEITSAYSVFANGGISMKPIAIKYVLDRDGKIIENNQPAGVRVTDPQTAFLTTSMLESVVKEGTGQRAKALNRSAAAKTGTTNEFVDAWFIGYTPELVTGVWVGFDNMRSLGKDETGSRAAAPIWVSFMKRALEVISPFEGQESEKGELAPFHIPDKIVTAVIDPLTGLLATNETEKMVEFFKEGTVPTEYSREEYRNQILEKKEELSKIEKINPTIDLH